MRFCSRRRISRRSVRTASPVGDEFELQPLRPGDRGELDFEHPHQIGDRDIRNFRPRRAGVEPRNVEKRAENFLDRLQRGIDVARKVRAFLGADLARDLGQRARIEPRGVERLQDVVARRREETGLGDIGFVRLVLGARKLGVEPLQLGGALIDAAFQQLVGGLKRFFDLNGLGDIGIGGDDAAVRQPRRAHLDHAVGREQTQPVRLIVIEEACDALGDEVLRISRPIGARGRR